MPQIHKIELEYSPEIKQQKYRTANLPLLEGMMDGCECGHWKISHRDNGECVHFMYGICDCQQFVPRNFELVVEITEIEIFENEVKDHSERDSFAWWNEFESWRRINEAKNI